MSTTLSDKAEDLLGSDLHAELRRWKDEVIAAVDEHFASAATTVAPQTGKALVGVQQAVKNDAQELVYKVEDYVIDHPVKSLACAAVAGFLLGVLCSR